MRPYVPAVAVQADADGVVIDPITKKPVEDPILKAALMEGAYYLPMRGKARVKINWPKLIEKRRSYYEIPDYDRALIQEDYDFMVKCAWGGTMVPISDIAVIWYGKGYNKSKVAFGLKFCEAMKIDTYRLPFETSVEYCLSSDLTIAIRSLKVDLEAEHGIEAKFIRWRTAKSERAAARAKRKALGLRKNSGDVETQPDGLERDRQTGVSAHA